MRTGRWPGVLSSPRQPLTAAADQYAFCVSVWEALAGAPPFSGKGLSDPGYQVRTFPVEVRGDEVWLKLPPEGALDADVDEAGAES